MWPVSCDRVKQTSPELGQVQECLENQIDRNKPMPPALGILEKRRFDCYGLPAGA